MGDTTGEEGEDDEESAAYPPGYDKWVTRGEVEKKAMVPNGKIWLGNRRRHVAEGTINDSVAQTQSRRE